MATIEERAKAIANKHTYIDADTEYDDVVDACIEIAIEQDRIARQEQREIDIEKACKWLLTEFEGGGYVQDWQIEEFRKAMEGGEQ